MSPSSAHIDSISMASSLRTLAVTAIAHGAWIFPPNGVSTHTREQVRRAVLDGADYLGVGPTFPSRTKEFESFPGLDFIREAVAATSLPTFALGGIGPENISQVVAAGGRRVAVSSCIGCADDPEQIARVLRAALDG